MVEKATTKGSLTEALGALTHSLTCAYSALSPRRILMPSSVYLPCHLRNKLTETGSISFVTVVLKILKSIQKNIQYAHSLKILHTGSSQSPLKAHFILSLGLFSGVNNQDSQLMLLRNAGTVQLLQLLQIHSLLPLGLDTPGHWDSELQAWPPDLAQGTTNKAYLQETASSI